MRNVNKRILNKADLTTQNGEQIDSNQLIAASFQARFTDSDAAGTIKIQASNDVAPQGPAPFTVTNWIDIPNASEAVTSGTSKLITIANMVYRWTRAVWTATAAVKATLVVQDLTYTAVNFGAAGNAITIEYVGDGVAGAETVDVVDTAITVHMDPTAITGSTAAQIRTAVLASAPAALLVAVAVSGTGSTVQAVASATPLASGLGGAGNVIVDMNALGM